MKNHSATNGSGVILAESVGQGWADAVFDAHTRLLPDTPDEAGVTPERVFEELIYLDSFVFEQVVNRLFPDVALQERILNAYEARLVLEHLRLRKSADDFQREYEERRSSFAIAWCAPPDYQASTYVAGEICRRCESFHFYLLTFFAQYVPRSYVTALEILNNTRRENQIV